MTIRTLISTIRGILKEESTDSILTNREIWNIAWAYALTYIQRKADSKRNLTYLNMFKEIQINFKEVSIVDGTDFELPVDCKIYRSINELPKLVESSFGIILKQISTLDGSKNYSLVTSSTFRDKLKLTKGKGKFVYIRNNYLYSNDKYPLLVSALFSNINSLLGKGCRIMDLEAPIPQDIISGLLQAVPQQLGLFKQVQQDTIANENPNN